MAQEMIFAQDWSAVDSKNYTERKDPVHGLVTIFHDVVIAREAVQPYDFEGKMVMAYKSAAELEQYWPWVDGRWAIAGRHPSTPVIVKPGDIAGRTVNPAFVKNLNDPKTGRNNIRGVKVDLEVFNDRVAPDILRGMKEGTLPDVSIGFLYGKQMTPGTWNGQEYDLEQVNMFHDHTAYGIKKGRCSYPACGIGADTLMQSKSLNEGGKNTPLSNMEPRKSMENDTLISIPVPGTDVCEDAQTISLEDIRGVGLTVCGDNLITDYTFSKDADWTLVKAEAWVDENKDKGVDAFGPRTPAERAQAHFEITAEEWEKLSDEEKQEYIDKLPPKGSADAVDTARAMEYYGVTADVWETMPDKVIEALITGLPEKPPAPGTDMSEDEIKDKIAALQEQINKFYEATERADPVDYSEVEPLYAEINGYKEALAAIIKARVLDDVEGDEAVAVDEVARTKRLLNSPHLKREKIRINARKG